MRKSILPLVCILGCSLVDASGASGPAAARAAEPAALHDVVVHGDSSGAVVAAISAKREGRSVLLVSPVAFLSGMSSSGLGAADFLAYRSTIGAIASEFDDGVAKAYGKSFVRSFELHVGKQMFEKLIADSGVTVVFNEQLDAVISKRDFPGLPSKW